MRSIVMFSIDVLCSFLLAGVEQIYHSGVEGTISIGPICSASACVFCLPLFAYELVQQKILSTIAWYTFVWPGCPNKTCLTMLHCFQRMEHFKSNYFVNNIFNNLKGLASHCPDSPCFHLEGGRYITLVGKFRHTDWQIVNELIINNYSLMPKHHYACSLS